jgi:hypothetical protein
MKKALLIVILSLFLTACGGGGGDNGGVNDAPFFGGRWEGTATLIKNECNLDVPSQISFTHTVNQVGSRVVLDVLGGGTFSGTVDDDHKGFSLAGPSTGDNRCFGQTALGYRDVDLNADTAGVAQLILGTCRNGFECQTGWVGSAVRTAK